MLPEDSAFIAAYRGGANWREWRGWGHDRTLLAAIYNAVNVNSQVNLMVAAGKKAKSVKPFPPWPGIPKQETKKPTRRLSDFPGAIRVPREG